MASLPFFNIDFLTRHRLVFTILQWTLFIGLSGRLSIFYFWKKDFHSRMEAFSYAIGWLIALSGLVINRWEPFKTEEQILAEQHFERFKSQRQFRVDLAGTCNRAELLTDLHRIDGVRKGSIDLNARTVTLSYHKEKVSAEEIFDILKKKGYVK
ncbi:heavy-metal-associated domain-containing protein [Dyadobacter sp.]|uniref:heavy-metal-associated domain-containing protein n=1 Tax=Dyadobacter sp. TaxID=1914288 RepID=UPI0025BFE786|nr:heavy-metal-associated domain-containing protein [Dyadobacter sp.]